MPADVAGIGAHPHAADLIDLDANAPLLSVATFADCLDVHGSGRRGKAKDEVLRGVALEAHVGRRARKGRRIEGFKPLVRLTG
ncbi:hypothetical protein [Azohydromonas sediminis]|uniref:hypothetical protein n=1 Tax=Azohydromonas sediminis TaxID=2259674 RepID=UPI000E65535E|nr:hypothetical protein [Azohydromonas sediminis]